MSDMADSHPDSKPDSSANLAAWTMVLEECRPGLRAFLKRRLAQESDVDDCLQAVYMKMLEAGDQVADTSRRAWLFRVAANEAAGFWRKQASTDRMLQKQIHDNIIDADPINGLVQHETTKQLQLALEKLSPEYRDVIRLRMVEDLTFQQIADQLQIPLGTALTRMRRGLEKLRHELQTDD